MGLYEFFTGRSEKEQDVYENEEMVEQVVSEIKTIATTNVSNAQEEITNAVNAINQVNGVAQFVGTINADGYSEVFTSVTEAITQIGDAIQNKAEDIKTYKDSKWYEKLGSTFAMTGAKLGEGILSVAEDIGDGVVSIAGWIAPKDSGFEKACEDFVKKDWSHDAFNFYYNSDFAKKSAYTEDSALASGVKIVGSTIGYLALGSAVAGVGGVAAKSSNGLIKAVGTFASSSTRMNTLNAALSGMGSGTESGLHSGLSMDEASVQGAKQAAIQGTIAYVGGKLGERSAKNSAIKEQEEIIKNADDILANKEKITAARSDIIKARKKWEQAILDEADDTTKAALQKEYETAQKALEKITTKHYKNVNFEVVEQTKNNAQKAIENINSGKVKFQGYNDKVSKAAREKAEDFSNRVAYNYKFQGQGPIQSVKNVVVEDAKNTFKTAQARVNQVAYDVQTATVSDTWNAIKTGANNLKEGAKNLKPKNLKPIITDTVVPAAVNTIKNPTNITTVANAAGREYMDSKGAEQFRVTEAARKIEPTPDDNVDLYPEKDVDYTINRKPTPSNQQQDPNPSPNPSPNPTPNPGTSQTQFRQTDPDPTPDPSNPTVGTVAPTTTAPSTVAPTTTAPSTVAPTTTAPSTNAPTSNITTPPSNAGNGNEATTGSTNTIHTGGGYTGTNGYTSSPSGYTPGQSNTTGNMTDGTIDGTTGTDSSLTGALTEGTTSIEDVIKGSKVTKIPTSPSPVTTTSSSSGSSAVIPIAAGLSAAAAAGIGAKAYMDRKHNNDNGEDDEDEFDTDEWSGDDSVDIQYDEDTANGENYLDDDDDYSYQATSNNEEKYDARSSEELADLQ